MSKILLKLKTSNDQLLESLSGQSWENMIINSYMKKNVLMNWNEFFLINYEFNTCLDLTKLFYAYLHMFKNYIVFAHENFASFTFIFFHSIYFALEIRSMKILVKK